jgi:nicotinamidase-related amidase
MKRKPAVNGPWGTLVVVDLQRAFDVPPELIEKTRRYSKRFHCRIFTRFENPPGSQFRQMLKQKCCAPGSEDTELLIAPSPGDLALVKRGYGLSPRDIRRIQELGIRRVTVCGVDTDACVLGVMFSLFDAGIECRVKPDLCWSSSGRRLHQAAMTVLRQQFPPPKGTRKKSA